MSVKTQTALQLFWKNPFAGKQFRSGVSLHSHTMYSEESLHVIPRYTSRLPYVGAAIRRHKAEYRRKRGLEFDFARAFWTPPLAPRQAYRLEEKQIQRRFHLPALVSLTDHDDIRAGTLIRVMDQFRKAPISTEWTVPFGPTFFHLGVHNLPPNEAPALMRQLADFTKNPVEKDLFELLSVLNSYSDTLLVLNHPLWDEKGIGLAYHQQALATLLERHGASLHAVELNGLRTWNENKEVLRLARQTGMPVISGGDRHGSEPNAVLNLSCATDLAGFIHEIRDDRFSHIVLMPQYREPMRFRVLQTMIDIVRDYPENLPGRRSWDGRVFFRDPATDIPMPIASIWPDGGPSLIRHFITAMRFLQLRGVRPALRLALYDRAASRPDQELVA